ncbi:virulence associated lipoprotein (plasmid) [Borreliella sinica]|uniref:virulence associated lipoprotein n=1 Tax=Borreliella sinica TaxID=87162 RepID=UPI002A24335D|nr:virulence associated lipoprotein [Borreliella sinica]WPM06346.1 virulence associated lipoprotein [Borreliella sinica]
MRYSIIAGIFVFLLLACSPDFNPDQKNMKYQSSKKGLKSYKKGLKPEIELTLNQEEGLNQKDDFNRRRKNTLINDLKKLIEIANANREKYIKKFNEEPSDKYGISAFSELFWQESGKESVSDNTERSKRYRQYTYAALNDIDTNALKKLSAIIILSGQADSLLNIFKRFGNTLDDVTVYLSSKKDTLEKLDILDLEKLKNSLEKLLSIKTIISNILNKLLLDYQNNENLIKTEIANFKSYINILSNQILEKSEEAKILKTDIFVMYNL